MTVAGLHCKQTVAENETGEVKNGCKSHQPQKWDRSENVWRRQHTGLGDSTVLDKSPTASILTKVMRKGKRAKAQEWKANGKHLRPKENRSSNGKAKGMARKLGNAKIKVGAQRERKEQACLA